MGTDVGSRDDIARPSSIVTTPAAAGGIDVPPDEVRAALERILATSLFTHSKRYPTLLRHVVALTLDGRTGELKERLIGTEVFGRTPSYDTNQDPVVRTTAGEVRKRLAQYYQSEGRTDALRIDLPAGSYVPRFYAAQVAQPPASSLEADAPTSNASRMSPVGASPPAPPRRSSRRLFASALVIALAVAVAAVYAWKRPAPATDTVAMVWAPLLATTGPVLVAVGPSPWPVVDAGDLRQRGLISLEAARSAARVIAFLERHGKQVDMKPVETVTLSTFRDQPIVLVGGFNNPWTVRFSSQLRFGLESGRDNSIYRIVDRQHPDTRGWVYSARTETSGAQVIDDYGIAARFVEPSSNQVVVMIGGLNRNGTAAAGEAITESRLLAALGAIGPTTNVEIVVGITSINGSPGPPRIVAHHVW